MVRGFESTPAWPPDTTLPAEYDPLLAKLMVHAEDRPAAVAGCAGPSTRPPSAASRPTSRSCAGWSTTPAFVTGAYDTGLIAEAWGDGPA